MWVKFCGIVRWEDVECAVSLEIDAIGVIAVPDTPRCVTEREAMAVAGVPRHSTKLVAVFQNPDRNYLEDMIAVLQPDLLQFHGDETLDLTTRHGVPYVKAVRGAGPSDVWYLRKHKDAFAWLVDASNLSVEDELTLSQLRATHADGRLVIAGGLQAENVAARARRFDAWGVDVSRGVERTPREKDHKLMKRFVNAVRAEDVQRI